MTALARVKAAMAEYSDDVRLPYTRLSLADLRAVVALAERAEDINRLPETVWVRGEEMTRARPFMWMSGGWRLVDLRKVVRAALAPTKGRRRGA